MTGESMETVKQFKRREKTTAPTERAASSQVALKKAYGEICKNQKVGGHQEHLKGTDLLSLPRRKLTNMSLFYDM